MEQEKMSASPAEERECFERVWRRVMPEDRPDCPFRLYSDIDREGPPPAQESAPASEREEDLAQEETDAPVGEGERLQAMIARAMLMLTGCSPGSVRDRSAARSHRIGPLGS